MLLLHFLFVGPIMAVIYAFTGALQTVDLPAGNYTFSATGASGGSS
jgi:hypothetical protein